jgi:hypothetical protein
MSRTWPLSLWQRHALRFEQARPGVHTGPWFAMNVVLRVEGDLDVRKLADAATDLVVRHEVLRTHLDLSAEEPVQVVEDGVKPDFEVLDADALSAAEWLHTPVLSTGPSPLKLRVGRRSPREHVLSLHMHHLLSDPSTLWRVLDDLAALYSARCGGAEPAPPTGQFGEFAEYETNLLRSGHAEAQAWWRDSLGRVKFAAPSPSARSEPFALRRNVLPAPVTTELERRSRTLRSSPFPVLLALLADSMAEHVSAGGHLPFSTLLLRRDHPRWRTMIGPCIVPVNLAVPLDAAADLPRFSEYIVAAQRYCRFPPWEAEPMNPYYTDPAAFLPFAEIVPTGRPRVVTFGPSTATVVTAAGSRDTGRAKNLGLRFRKTDDGSMVAHLSGNGTGWTSQAVNGALDALPQQVHHLS